MMKELMEEFIVIDFGAFEDGYCFGSDEVFNSYPCVFPTVTFTLFETGMLDRLADKVCIEAGLQPMFDDRYECDLDGWYDFSIAVNGFSDTKVDAGICFERVNSTDEGYGIHTISLTEEEQKIIFEILNEQCLKQLNKSCDDLLNEARREMMELKNPDRQDEELWV